MELVRTMFVLTKHSVIRDKYGRKVGVNAPGVQQMQPVMVQRNTPATQAMLTMVKILIIGLIRHVVRNLNIGLLHGEKDTVQVVQKMQNAMEPLKFHVQQAIAKTHWKTTIQTSKH